MAAEYEADFHAWAIDQAARLRAGQSVDVENIAEELESLGRGERRELVSHLHVLLLHKLKWDFQPAERSRSWEISQQKSRLSIGRTMKDNPSLKPFREEALRLAYEEAILSAAEETGLDPGAFPLECPYPVADLFPHSKHSGRPAVRSRARKSANH